MKAALAKESVAWDWMRPEAATIQVDATIEDAVHRMKRLSIHHLIVMDGRNYRGMLDARDCAGIWDKNTQVLRVMQSQVSLVDENTEIGEVVERMVSGKLTALPLKKNQKVHGIITATDLVRLLESEFSRGNEVSRWINKGKNFLTRPIIQSLSSLLGNAGL